MNEQIIQEQYKQIISLIDNKQLMNALFELKSFTVNIPNWEIHNTLEEIQTSYNYMLDYLMKGIADPDRDKLYNQLVGKLYTLADRAYNLLRAQHSNKYYYDRLRYFNHLPSKTMASLLMDLEAITEETTLKSLINADDSKEASDFRQRYESILSELFYRVWTSDIWSEQERIEAQKLLESALIPTNALALFVSAVTLSLTEYFDVKKVLFLFSAYEHVSNEINQRAIVGLAIIIYLYDSRISVYPEISSYLKLYDENPQFEKNMLTIQIQFLRSRDTEKIDKKMREEIIPEMVKNMGKTNFPGIEDFDEDSNSDDINPNWEGWNEKSGLNDKLRQMSELQMEGADVYMSTFSQLKRYSFFNELANWFYPFDSSHSSVSQVINHNPAKQQSLLNNLLASAFFCNSDKYSFCFTIMQVPEMQRSMMMQQLEEQKAQMDEGGLKNQMDLFSQRTENISNQYIHDLYRFYHLHPKRYEYWNPFNKLNLYRCNTLKNITRRHDYMYAQANFLFQKGYFLEASPIFEDINNLFGNNEELSQKTGYCYQKGKDYESAVKAYLYADIQTPDNIWTIRHLATCYRQLRQYDKALEYYHKIEQVDPDDLKIMVQIGVCLTHLEHYEEALGYFFKFEYLNGNSAKIWRAIGWCSFVSGKYEQAEKYFDKLTGYKEAQANDYFNAGHVNWVLKKFDKAVSMYLQCYRMLPQGHELVQMFRQDTPTLQKKGIAAGDIPLIIDLIIKHN